MATTPVVGIVVVVSRPAGYNSLLCFAFVRVPSFFSCDESVYCFLAASSVKPLFRSLYCRCLFETEKKAQPLRSKVLTLSFSA